MKKILSFTLALIILASVALVPAFAEDLGQHIAIGDFELEVVGSNKAVIAKYHGNAEELTIPAKLDGYQIVGIAPYAFEKNITLQYIILSAGIEEIGERAFALCKSLCGVTIPNTVTTIGAEAFLYCTNLNYIDIPDSVTSIGDRALGYNRRKLDLDTLEYTYQVYSMFAIHCSKDSVAKTYAEKNGCNGSGYSDYTELDIFEFVFNVPTEWTNYNKIYCHITEVGNDTRSYNNWQSKATICAEKPTDSVLCSFNQIGGMEYGTVYEVIFSTDTGYQTHPAVITMYHNYDILSTDHTYVVFPADMQHRLVAKWENVDTSAYEDALGYWDDAYIYVATPDEATGDEATGDEATGDEATGDEKPMIDALPYGDVDCNGKVNVKDATAIQKHIADLTKLSDVGLILADFYSNGNISVKNATDIQKYCADLLCNDQIGVPAYTTVIMVRPDQWDDNATIQIISWNEASTNDESVCFTRATPQNQGNNDVMEFYIPVYNPKLVICCENGSSPIMTLSLPAGSENSTYNYVAFPFGTDENGLMQFIWEEHA